MLEPPSGTLEPPTVTPTKKKLRRKVETYRKQSFRLRNSLQTARRVILSKGKSKSDLSIAKDIRKHLSGPALELVMAQLTSQVKITESDGVIS